MTALEKQLEEIEDKVKQAINVCQQTDASRVQDRDYLAILMDQERKLKIQIDDRRQILNQKPYKPSTSADVLVAGNPGSGKSALLNSMMQKVLFKSGLKNGTGLTRQLDVTEHMGQKYIDTPGFADESVRTSAGKQISERLRQGGKLQILFLVQQNSGRVINEDRVTIQIVLEAAPEIGSNYGVIVNRVPENVLDKIFNTEADRHHFAQQFLCKLDEKLRTKHFFFNRSNPNLDDLDNTLAPLPQDLRVFLHTVPVCELCPDPTITINTQSYNDLVTSVQRESETRREVEGLLEKALNGEKREFEARREVEELLEKALDGKRKALDGQNTVTALLLTSLFGFGTANFAPTNVKPILQTLSTVLSVIGLLSANSDNPSQRKKVAANVVNEICDLCGDHPKPESITETNTVAVQPDLNDVLTIEPGMSIFVTDPPSANYPVANDATNYETVYIRFNYLRMGVGIGVGGSIALVLLLIVAAYVVLHNLNYRIRKEDNVNAENEMPT